MMHFLLSLLALLLPSQPAAPQEESAASEQLEITYLANDGFLLRVDPFTVMIDGFVGAPVDDYVTLPKRVSERLRAGKKPFRGRIFCLVSHPHPDHFQAPLCEQFLASNPRASLITGPRVVQHLREEAKDFDAIKGRVRSVAVDPGRIRVVDLAEGFRIALMQMPHVGNLPSPNYAHIIDMGGFKILHVGDADVSPEVFSELGFPGPKVDVAIVPFWFLTSEDGIRILDEMVRPTAKIVTHVPKGELELFSARLELENPDAILFQKPLESRVLARAKSADAATAEDTDG